MKWFLIQSLGLALLAFGLGALFHRLLWRKTVGGTFNTGSGGSRPAAPNAAGASAERADLDARVAELRSVKAENLSLIGERNAKAKELSALSFEHGAAKAKLAEHEAELERLRASLQATSAEASAGSGEALDAVRREHEEAMAKLREEHDAALAAVRSDHEGVVAKLREEHDAALAAVRSDHEARVQGLVGEHESKVTSLISGHEAAIAALTNQGHESLASLKAEHDAEVARLRSEAERHRLAAETAAAALATKPVAPESHAAPAGGDDGFEGDDVTPDDFLKIEGIGPKVNEILRAGGVRTYRRLASMSEERVRSIVNAGGVSFTPSAGTWAAQAALLRDGDHAGFQALVDKLLSGREESR